MKKILYSMLALLMATFTFTSCEDVPAPYDDPNNNGGEDDTPVVEGEYLNETFSSSFGKFEVVTVKGTPWTIDYNTAKASGYDNTSKVTTASESYLISPAVDLSKSTGAYLQFEYIYQYKRDGAVNKVLITDNYTGDPTTTAWEDITGEFTVGSDWTTFYTYNYNLDSKYIGKSNVRIALYYSCGTQSSTIEIKNLVLKEGSVDVPDTPDTPTEDVLKPVNGTFINETFASSFGVFTATTVKGEPWIIDYSTAKATGYANGSTTPSEAYLISKPMDMSSTTAATISFEYILRYYTNYGAAKPGVEDKVLITSNYTGDPSTTSWTDITGTLTEGSDWSTFSKYSASVPSAFLGKDKVVIALYYACNDNSATWEVKNMKVVEGTGSETGGSTGGETSGNTISVDMSSLGLTNGEALTTVTLSDGTTLSFDGGGNTNSPKYYTNGTNVRMYPKNTMTVASSSKTISSIKIVCDVVNGVTCNASGDISSSKGTVSVNDANVSITGISNGSVVITNTSSTTGTASQIRMKTLAITYTE